MPGLRLIAKRRNPESDSQAPAVNVVAHPRHFELELYLPFLINRVASTMLRLSSMEFHKLGLTVPTFRILALLHANKSLQFRDLAAQACIERPSLSRHLDELVEAGLARRRRDRDDLRSVIVLITPAGRRRIEGLLPSAIRVGEDILEGLTRAEERCLRASLTKIHRNLEKCAANWGGLS